MGFSWIVALRFLREGRMQSVLIIGGVAVGVAVLVFLSALIGGLQESLIQRTLGTQAHIVVRSPDNAAKPVMDRSQAEFLSSVEQRAQRVRSLSSWPKLVKSLAVTPGVTAVAPTINGPAFALRGAAEKAIVIKGIDLSSYAAIVDVDSYVKQGQARLDGSQVLIGTELAKDLGLDIGDKLRLSSANGADFLVTVAAIFDLRNQAVNKTWVLTSLRLAQSLFAIPGDITAVELRVDSIFDADKIAAGISAQTGQTAESWMQLNSQLLIALRSQSSSSIMIQFFVILAVALGIASVLVVSVVQKSKEIGILKAMGARTSTILRVFLLQGFLVGFIGSVAGILGGVGLALFFANIARNADGSATFPLALGWGLYTRAALVASVTGILSAVAPARRAAKLDPAVVIRNG